MLSVNVKNEIARIIAETRSARNQWVRRLTAAVCVWGDLHWGRFDAGACGVKGEADGGFGNETSGLALGPRL